VLPCDADLGLKVGPMPLQFEHYRRQLDRLGPRSDDDNYLVGIGIQAFLPSLRKSGEAVTCSTLQRLL